MGRYLLALLGTSLRASMALRGAFWLQVAFMLLNNLIFFVMWWVFFGEIGEVRGWRVGDMAAIYGVCAGAFGLAVVFGGGAREIARLVSEGDLDTYLALPRHPLPACIAARSRPSGWGDIVSAFVLIGFSGYARPAVLPLGIVASVCGGAVFCSATVIANCVAFWFGDTRTFSTQVSDFLVIFGGYPKTVFTGALRLFLYVVVPAGFFSFLPVELVRGFSWPLLLGVAGGALLWVALMVGVFALGLRRYESGNRFGVRA